MAFDFNNIDTVKPEESLSSEEGIQEKVREKINIQLTYLNHKYNEYIISGNGNKKSLGMYYEKPEDVFEYRVSNYTKEPGVHFYTRNIKNSGISAWKTLLFWVDTQEQHNLFPNISFDGAAFCTHNFYLDSLGLSRDEDYRCFKIISDDILEVNLDYIMQYMEIIKKFIPDDPRPQFMPYAYAAFRTGRLLTFNCDYDIIKKFVNYCSTYEANPVYQTKFNISFAMCIVKAIIMHKNINYDILVDISKEYKNYLTENEDIFLSPNIFASILLKYIKI